MATRNPHSDRTATQATLTAFADSRRARAIGLYQGGDRVDQVAERLETDLETVARYLRRAGVLAPYDDPRALAHLYERHGSLERVAEVFEYARGPESIRSRMEYYGLERGEQSLADELEGLNPEDAGLSPMTGDDHAKFTKRGERA